MFNAYLMPISPTFWNCNIVNKYSQGILAPIKLLVSQKQAIQWVTPGIAVTGTRLDQSKRSGTQYSPPPRLSGTQVLGHHGCLPGCALTISYEVSVEVGQAAACKLASHMDVNSSPTVPLPIKFSADVPGKAAKIIQVLGSLYPCARPE